MPRTRAPSLAPLPDEVMRFHWQPAQSSSGGRSGSRSVAPSQDDESVLERTTEVIVGVNSRAASPLVPIAVAVAIPHPPHQRPRVDSRSRAAPSQQNSAPLDPVQIEGADVDSAETLAREPSLVPAADLEGPQTSVVRALSLSMDSEVCICVHLPYSSHQHS